MNLSGIYKVVNPIGETYIGQTKNYFQRIRHFSNKSNRLSPIYMSIKQYGRDSHSITLIHQLPSDVCPVVLDNYEQLYIDLYRECGTVLLNIRDAGNNGKHSVSTKQKISLSKTGIKPTISESKREEMRLRKIGNIFAKGLKHTDEQKNRKKILMSSASWSLPKRQVLCLNNNKIYSSQREAACDLCISYKHIASVCRGKRNHVGGFKFSYL